MLCRKCSSIHFQRIEDCEVIQREPARLHNAERNISSSGSVFYFHHDSKKALQASAENGCHFCEMLFRHLFESPHYSSRPDYSFVNGEVIFRRSVIEQWIARDNGFQDWNNSDWIYIYCEDSNATTSRLLDFEGRRSLL